MEDKIANALIRVFESANVWDANGENANMVDASSNIANALWAIVKILKEDK